MASTRASLHHRGPRPIIYAGISRASHVEWCSFAPCRQKVYWGDVDRVPQHASHTLRKVGDKFVSLAESPLLSPTPYVRQMPTARSVIGPVLGAPAATAATNHCPGGMGCSRGP